MTSVVPVVTLLPSTESGPNVMPDSARRRLINPNYHPHSPYLPVHDITGASTRTSYRRAWRIPTPFRRVKTRRGQSS